MNKHILRIIKEQFNVSDLDFSDDGEEQLGANIFNKQIFDPFEVYSKIQNRKRLSQ